MDEECQVFKHLFKVCVLRFVIKICEECSILNYLKCTLAQQYLQNLDKSMVLPYIHHLLYCVHH